MNHSLPGPNCLWGIRTNEHGGLTAAAVCRDYPTQGILFHTESSGRSPRGRDCLECAAGVTNGHRPVHAPLSVVHVWAKPRPLPQPSRFPTRPTQWRVSALTSLSAIYRRFPCFACSGAAHQFPHPGELEAVARDPLGVRVVVVADDGHFIALRVSPL